ncbi:MAG: hypothetical protein WKF52_07170 [Sphingomicrobium sp.]
MAKNDVALITGASGFIGGAIIRRLPGNTRSLALIAPKRRIRPPGQGDRARSRQDEAVRSALEAVRVRFGGRIAYQTLAPKFLLSDRAAKLACYYEGGHASARDREDKHWALKSRYRQSGRRSIFG